MGYFFEIFAATAALLADLLLGNIGCTPYLTVYVLFHASRSLSPRFAAVMALVFGLAVDLGYCRDSAWTPVLFVAALFAGRSVLKLQSSEKNRDALSSLLPGAVMGAILATGELIPASGDELYGGTTVLWRLCSGIFWGALAAAAATAMLNALFGYLGLAAPSGSSRKLGENPRRHQVRSVRMGRRSR